MDGRPMVARFLCGIECVWMRRETDGALRCVRRFRYSVGATIGRPFLLCAGGRPMVAPTEYVEILHHAIGNGLSGTQNRRFYHQNAAAVRFARKNRPPPPAARANRPARALRAGRFSAILIAIHKFLLRRLHLWTTPALPTAIYARRARLPCGTICTRRSYATRAYPICEIDARFFFNASIFHIGGHFT